MAAIAGLVAASWLRLIGLPTCRLSIFETRNSKLGKRVASGPQFLFSNFEFRFSSPPTTWIPAFAGMTAAEGAAATHGSRFSNFEFRFPIFLSPNDVDSRFRGNDCGQRHRCNPSEPIFEFRISIFEFRQSVRCKNYILGRSSCRPGLMSSVNYFGRNLP